MCVCVCARTVSAASLSQVKQLSQTTGNNTDLSSVSISDKLRQFVSNFCLYKDKRSFGPPAILNHITYALFIFPHIIETRLSRSNHKILHFSVIFWGKKRHHMSSPTSYFLTLVKRGCFIVAVCTFLTSGRSLLRFQEETQIPWRLCQKRSSWCKNLQSKSNMQSCYGDPLNTVQPINCIFMHIYV